MNDQNPQALTLDLGEVDLQYLLYDGPGPDLVLVHATGFMPWLWHPIARALAKNFRVIAPYVCDHRNSDPYAGGLGWGLVADDLYQMCARLELQRPRIVGHSMGAAVAALTEALHGPLFERMILIEPIFLESQVFQMQISPERHPMAAGALRRRDGWESEDEAFAYLRSKAMFKTWDEEILELYVRHGMIESGGGLKLACAPEREAAMFMGAMHVDPWPLLPRVTCPTLLVEAALSANRNFIDHQKVVEVLPRGEFKVMEGMGHLAPMDQPAAVGAVIEEYFRDQ